MSTSSTIAPEQALHALADQLGGEDSVIAEHVRDADEVPGIGLLAAAGPRAADAPGEYALLTESIREGYLLHYGTPRVVVGVDDDLALLAGDYLYARGLERLAALGSMEAVRELSDLISLSAQVHAGGAAPIDTVAPALWLASTTSVTAGGGEQHEDAKAALRNEHADAARSLIAAARAAAGRAEAGGALERAADSVGLAIPEDLSDLG
jgi:hypothetical protein